MQLVVEISEDTFFDLKKKQNRTEVDNAVLNGTPLPHGNGKWIKENPAMIERYPYCSNCGFVNPFDELFNYCPNCGAYMKCDFSKDDYKNRVIGVDLNHTEDR